jgi:uncharacterized repeat protein (TIGR03987 family)
MNDTLIKAVIVVTIALLFYSIGVISEQRKRMITKSIIVFLTAGIIFDISSTALMIAGSGKIPITVHGFIGYSALSVMLVDTILIWRFWLKNKTSHVPIRLNLYTRFAYGWWVVAFIAGAIISMTVS